VADFGDAVRDVLDRLDVRGVLDILIIGLIFFWLLVQVRGTTAMALLRGIAIMFAAAWAMSSVLDLQVLSFLLRNSLTGLLIAAPIVFQPEIRRALEQVGRLGIRGLFAPPALDTSADSVVEAAAKLSRERHGALIIIERETGLQDYIDTGVSLDAAPTPELLEGIFFPNSPLHDGAVIMRENRIIAAGVTLPLAEHAVKGSGTRHRAALGISERTDAVSIVVSEETGNISVAYNGRLLTRLTPDRLRDVLDEIARGRAISFVNGQRYLRNPEVE